MTTQMFMLVLAIAYYPIVAISHINAAKNDHKKKGGTETVFRYSILFIFSTIVIFVEYLLWAIVLMGEIKETFPFWLSLVVYTALLIITAIGVEYWAKKKYGN